MEAISTNTKSAIYRKDLIISLSISATLPVDIFHSADITRDYLYISVITDGLASIYYVGQPTEYPYVKN